MIYPYMTMIRDDTYVHICMEDLVHVANHGVIFQNTASSLAFSMRRCLRSLHLRAERTPRSPCWPRRSHPRSSGPFGMALPPLRRPMCSAPRQVFGIRIRIDHGCGAEKIGPQEHCGVCGVGNGAMMCLFNLMWP